MSKFNEVRTRADMQLLFKLFTNLKQGGIRFKVFERVFLALKVIWKLAPAGQFANRTSQALNQFFVDSPTLTQSRGAEIKVSFSIKSQMFFLLESQSLDRLQLKHLLDTLPIVQTKKEVALRLLRRGLTTSTGGVTVTARSRPRRSPISINIKMLQKEVLSKASYLPPPFVAARRANQSTISVYFLTNREKALDHKSYGTGFTNERSTHGNSYGVAKVSIPSIHSEGSMERPSKWKFEFSENPAKHLTIQYVGLFSQTDWLNSASNPGKEALLFIHGYNVDFEEALFRTAQIAYDLKFQGLPLCFSWASRGEVLNYLSDEGTIEWSAQHLHDYLRLVTVELQITKLHVIAHSMGNRALLAVLRDWEHSTNATPLSQIVLAAPDVDIGIFTQIATSFGKIERVTLYASSNDGPLKLSRHIHNYRRAGEANPPLVLQGLDTIDVTSAGNFLFGTGHSYFSQTTNVFSDLFYVIGHGTPASQRAGLRFDDSGGFYRLIR